MFFFALRELGERWCLAVSDPFPRGCRFGFVRARSRHVFCLRTGAFFVSFRGSKGTTSQPCEGSFFASSELGFRWCLGVSDPLPRGCRFGFVRARSRYVFCLRTGACFFSFRGSRGAISQPCEGPFFASSEPGFRWCLAVGCVTFSVYVLGLFSSSLGAPKVPLRNPAKDGFSLRLSPDLGGVWLFCIHCREVAALGVSGLGCVTFSVEVLLRNPAKDGFWLRLSPDLGGVWLLCIHCRKVAALGVSGLGCVTFSVYVLGLVSSPLGAPKVPLCNPAKDGFSLRLSPDLGGVWLFCIHCREVAALGVSGLGCVTFSVYVLGLVSSPLGAPKVPLRNPAKDGFSLRLSPDLGGVWLFCIHCREVAAWGLSGLGCVTFSVYVLGLFSSPLGAPKVPLRNPAKDGFSLRLSPDLGGVWLLCIHCRKVAALGVSGLGCVTFSVYVLGLFSSPLGAPKVPLRNPAKTVFRFV